MRVPGAGSGLEVSAARLRTVDLDAIDARLRSPEQVQRQGDDGPMGDSGPGTGRSVQ
ncbi:MAG: hypothetical protein ACREM1_19255 [Longimicrobiales bacterium]